MSSSSAPSSSNSNSDYSRNSTTEEAGGASSFNLEFFENYDNVFLDDWFSSAYTSDNQVQPEMDSSSAPSPFPLSPFPSTFNSNSPSGDGSVSVGLSAGEVQDDGDVQFNADSMIDWEKFLESGEIITGGDGTSTELDLELEKLAVSGAVISSGDSSSREPKRLKTSSTKKILGEGSTSAKKPQTKGFGKKCEKLLPSITALQELVCPYEKADTSAVLEITARTIKDLHQEIKCLTQPSIGAIGSSNQPATADGTCDLRSRGLCLVPITPVVQELASRPSPHQSVPERVVSFSRFHGLGGSPFDSCNK